MRRKFTPDCSAGGKNEAFCRTTGVFGEVDSPRRAPTEKDENVRTKPPFIPAEKF